MKSWLGSLLRATPEECRREIAHGLSIYGGNVTKTAAYLQVSRPFLWFCLRRLKMDKVPEEQRKRWAERFKITASEKTEA